MICYIHVYVLKTCVIVRLSSFLCAAVSKLLAYGTYYYYYYYCNFTDSFLLSPANGITGKQDKQIKAALSQFIEEAHRKL